jgi:phage baseplate assembly protein W
MSLPTTTTIYGKLLSNVSKNIATSKINKLTGFKYPIEESPSRGYFSKSTGLDLIKNNVRILLKTMRGERFMLPDYGCNLKYYLMEPLDNTLMDTIKNDVQESISKYLSNVSILKLQVSETRTGALNVNLVCGLRDNDLVRFESGVTV